MIYENLKGIYKPINSVFSGGGVNKAINRKYENVNGINKQVYKINPLYFIKNKQVVCNYNNSNHVSYETYVSPQGYHYSPCNILETTANGFHFGTTVHNNQNNIYFLKKIRPDDYKKLTITITQINYSQNRDYDSRLMLVVVEKMEQAYRVYKDFFNELSSSPPTYYRAGTYTVNLPRVDYDYYVALKPYSTVSSTYRSSRFDCTISDLFLHN